ncbi:MAG: TfuA domain-containing protein [Pseudomonadota bacterium]|nr:TfuA domain-containing protein [Pseudomonadota bacterium]
MRVVAFAGPSLPAEDRAGYPAVEWRPPAEAGDLLRLVPSPSLTVCLIDGYFDHRPAVRHKEILLLLSEGVRIYGASSIGALRAAEMAPFGMTGIGTIWRAYADGRTAGDDEVALVHGPAEWDWRPLSVPMVEVRATLCGLLREGALAADEARALRAAAARIHYADRGWESIAAEARRPALASSLAAAHLPQKSLDANACVEAALRYETAEGRPPPPVVTAFLRALARELEVDLAARTR